METVSSPHTRDDFEPFGLIQNNVISTKDVNTLSHNRYDDSYIKACSAPELI